jgi:hypothetical protein
MSANAWCSGKLSPLIPITPVEYHIENLRPCMAFDGLKVCFLHNNPFHFEIALIH